MADEPVLDDLVIEEGELTDEVDEVAEMLAVHSIVSEERHGEIITGVEQCQARLTEVQQQLAAQPAPESPALSQIQRELSETRSEITEIRAKVDLLLSQQSPPSSSPQPSPSPEPTPPAPSPESGGDLPAPETPPPSPEPQRRRRVQKI